MKLNKRGISLITLIITIVVLIILVAVVMISLGNNNPINQARVASVAQTRDSINSEVSTYLAKVKADTFGEYSTTEILLGNKAETLKYKVTADEITYINENEHTKEVYKLDKEKAKAHLNVELKEIDKKADWYVDEYGKVYLLYDTKNDVTSYLKEGEDILPTLQSFVTYKANGENPISGGSNKTQAEISFAISSITKKVEDATCEQQVANTGDGHVKYISSDETVATVDENTGVVEIHKNGNITITARVEDSATYTYPVKEATYTLSTTYRSYEIGDAVTITKDGVTHNFWVFVASDEETPILKLITKENINTTTLTQTSANKVAFSATQFWWDTENDRIKERYGRPNVVSENPNSPSGLTNIDIGSITSSDGKYALYAAQEYGKKMGGAGRLLNVFDLRRLRNGGYDALVFANAGKYKSVNNGLNYWLDTVSTSGEIYHGIHVSIVNCNQTGGEESCDNYYSNNFSGVRPVVEISKLSIDL